MIESIVGAALWAVIASVIIAVALAGIVLLIINTARPVALTRHMLWIIALFISGLAPLAIGATMATRGALAAASAAAVSLPTFTSDTERAEHAAHTATQRSAPGLLQLPASNAGTQPRKVATVAFPYVPGIPCLDNSIAVALAAAWLLGAALGIGGLIRSIVRVRSLKARSTPLDGTLADELPWLTAPGGREIYLRLSYEIETPIAVGFRRPFILIPTEMATADGLSGIESLVMHEYAHLVCYDDWTNLIQRTIERTFWFNPLVWEMGRRIALEREVAADEAVVERTHDAPDYAATLWRMAREMRMPEHVAVAPGAMLTRKQITIRIERLLDERGIKRPRLRAAALTLAALGTCGVAAAAATAPPLIVTHIAPVPTVVQHVVVSERDGKAPVAVAIAAGASAPPERHSDPTRPVAPPRFVVHGTLNGERIDIDSARDARAQWHAETAASFAARQHELKLALRREIPASIKRDIAQVLARPVPAMPAMPAYVFGHAFRAISPSAPLTRELINGADGVNLSGRDMRRLDLSNVHLMGADLSGANLIGANLKGIRLTGVDLHNADLRDADLGDAELTGVNLDGANLSGARLDGIRVIGTSFGHVILAHNGSLRSLVNGCHACDLSGVDLSGQDLHGISLHAAELSNANLARANMRGMKMHGTNLENANLSNADLTDASLTGVNLDNANMSGATLTNIRLIGSSLP